MSVMYGRETYVRYTSTRMQQFVQFVRHFLIRNRSHFYDLPLDLCEKCRYGCGTFAKHSAIFAKRTTIRQTRFIFIAKSAAILGLQHFTRRRTAARPSKCGAHGGRNAVHMLPCFQVPLRHVYCILFDAYCMGIIEREAGNTHRVYRDGK